MVTKGSTDLLRKVVDKAKEKEYLSILSHS